ncbi:MAG: aminotransferase class I/II-fold pyridoxal phosphate-dependent enzyme [Deltaproteobacteria bacterium]|nr:aminotransferase class I/II-fold pyridoxal phosphate-dependent enzyme [Deltaproteobacteria bacterium]
MNPLAVELNEKIEQASPDVLALLSERGRALYWPKGILSQTAEARDKAHRFNATIGEATEDGGPMALRSVLDQVPGLKPADIVRYAPAPGKPELRQAWQKKLLDENPSMASVRSGVPIVTHAITHGLALVGDLFVDPEDRLLLPDKFWGNYRLTYEVRLGATIETYNTYTPDGGFDVPAMREALLQGPDKTILLLNFPNNPTGYMPTRAEVEAIRDAVVEAAEAGKRLLVVTDDAYYGLVYDDDALQESPFGLLAGLHPRVLSVKLDGATKELFVWGLRCGFLTFGAPPVDGADAILEALEKKVMGAIRGGISNCAQLSQSVVLNALQSPKIGDERREKLEILKARALRVKQVAGDSKYTESWDVYPFNAGYFMCIRLKRGVDAEALRLHLLDEYGVGLISNGRTDIRVAFSCLELDEIEPLFDCVHAAIGDLA